MPQTILLVKNTYLLQKIEGKGGWTYAAIPEIAPDKQAPFGWVKVRGTIDGYPISKYHLMPMGNGMLFLPVKAAIRKAIRKKAGDTVFVELFRDDEPTITPQEFMDCLSDSPEACTFYHTLSEGEKQHYIKWIYSAKSEATKVERMSEAITTLSGCKKFYHK